LFQPPIGVEAYCTWMESLWGGWEKGDFRLRIFLIRVTIEGFNIRMLELQSAPFGSFAFILQNLQKCLSKPLLHHRDHQLVNCRNLTARKETHGRELPSLQSLHDVERDSHSPAGGVWGEEVISLLFMADQASFPSVYGLENL
jgi:hypothetical protein